MPGFNSLSRLSPLLTPCIYINQKSKTVTLSQAVSYRPSNSMLNHLQPNAITVILLCLRLWSNSEALQADVPFKAVQLSQLIALARDTHSVSSLCLKLGFNMPMRITYRTASSKLQKRSAVLREAVKFIHCCHVEEYL